jgi:hypothetical protein
LFILQGLNRQAGQMAAQAMGPEVARGSDAVLTGLNFSSVVVGQSLDKGLKVHNIGTDVLSVISITSDNAHFSVDSQDASFTVDPGGVRGVTVRFSPTAVGTQSGVLSIASSDPDAATIAIQLQGSGVGVPSISVAPDLLDFGRVDVGQSLDKALTVRNTGTAALSVTGITSDNPRFSVVSPAGPFPVAPNDQQPVTVTVRFSPTAVGTQSGVLSIASNDPAESPRTIDLKGVGEGVPNISVAPDPLDFGRVDVGQSLDKALMVRNTGTGTLSVTALSTTNARFSVVPPPVCSPDCFTVAPGSQHSVTVRFSPTAEGAQSGQLGITSNDPDPAPFPLTVQGTGKGVPNIAVDQSILNFGSVCIGQSATQGLTVRNTGTSTLSVTDINITNRFSVVAPAVPFSVAPNASPVTVTIRFSPNSLDAQGGLSIFSNDPDTAVASLQLRGTGIPRDPPCSGTGRCCEPGECGGCRPGFCVGPSQQCK